MSVGLIGKKLGMTRIFTDTGSSIPVSVVLVEPNNITQVKTVENDGYQAIQVTTGSKKASRLTKAGAGHFKKAGVEAGRGLWEFRVDGEMGAELTLGSSLTVELFEVGQKVDVTGVTKGKGFAGVIKRYNFAMQDATHGNSKAHRAPGSIGMCQTPGRVFKGKKMAGHMGNKQRTVQSLDLVRIDVERNLLLIKGGIPGAIGGDIVIHKSVKGS